MSKLDEEAMRYLRDAAKVPSRCSISREEDCPECKGQGDIKKDCECLDCGDQHTTIKTCEDCDGSGLHTIFHKADPVPQLSLGGAAHLLCRGCGIIMKEVKE